MKNLPQTRKSSFDLTRVVTKKRNLNDEKYSNIINGVHHWIREISFVFEDSNRIIKFWNCDNDNFFSPDKVQRSYKQTVIHEQIVLLDHHVMRVTAESDLGHLQHQRALNVRCCRVLDLNLSLCCLPLKSHTFCIFVGNVETFLQIIYSFYIPFSFL